MAHADSCNTTVDVSLEFRDTAIGAQNAVFLDDIQLVKLYGDCLCDCCPGHTGGGIFGTLTLAFGCDQSAAGTQELHGVRSTTLSVVPLQRPSDH
eukprot:977602-Rhodomonas_salina.1